MEKLLHKLRWKRYLANIFAADLILLPLIMLLCFTFISAHQVERLSGIPDGDYAIYSALIRDMFAGGKVTFDTGSKVNLLVIQNRLVSDQTRGRPEREHEFVRQMLKGASEETISDFKMNSNVTDQLQRRFDLAVEYVIVEKEKLDRPVSKDTEFWSEFYKTYPDSGGYVSLSRVGFNKARTQALVYIEHDCNTLCATGHYVLLAKRDDCWTVVQRAMAWIS